MAEHDIRVFLSEWLQRILEQRADKNWTPCLFADARTASYLGEIAGVKVQVDSSLESGKFVVRCLDSERNDPHPVFGPDDGLRASYSGIAVPNEED